MFVMDSFMYDLIYLDVFTLVICYYLSLKQSARSIDLFCLCCLGKYLGEAQCTNWPLHVR